MKGVLIISTSLALFAAGGVQTHSHMNTPRGQAWNCLRMPPFRAVYPFGSLICDNVRESSDQFNQVRLLEMAKSLVRSALILLIATALACSTAWPQEENPRDAPVLDPEINPKPFDPRYELREYFRAHLSGGWWAEEPTYNLATFRVLVHAPKRWRGNPNGRRAPDPGA